MRVQTLRHGLMLLAVATACSADPTTLVTSTSRFEFHSDPWINLHHSLYQWAREDLGPIRGRPPMPERSDVAAMPSRDRDTWMNAVKFYRDAIGQRWHLDRANMELNQELLKLGGNMTASPPDTIKGISATLAAAMPIYRKLWWQQHDRGNRAWVAKLIPLLRKHEPRFVDLTKRIYDAKWPDSPFRVDVSAYFNARAGYTSIDGHIVMYSTDPASQDLYALEMLFHEVQHADLVGGRAVTSDALAPAFQAAGTKQPDNLWHALIFATAGEFVRLLAMDEKSPEHTPYWIKQGFERQDGWKHLIPAIQKYWLPVIRGESSRAEAVAALARAF